MVRRLPASAALGLLAAFAAHGVAYGSGHQMGGEYVGLLRSTALFATLGLALGWIALSWIAGKHVRNGGILAAAAERFMPAPLGVVAAAVCWFSVAESIESRHTQAPALLIVAAIVLASAAVTALSRAILRALAQIVFSIRSSDFNVRRPRWTQITRKPIRLEPLVRARRLFSRPPPLRLRFS